MNKIRNIAIVLSLLYGLTFRTAVQGQDSSATNPVVPVQKGFLDFNGYYDTREFTVATINILSALPNRFEYFSLTNYQSGKGTTDLSTFYSEQNLRWKPTPKLAIDLTAQLIVRAGNGNDNVFLGFLWKPSSTRHLAPFFKRMHLFYFANVHVVRLSEISSPRYFRQIEHVYKLDVLPRLLHKRVYIAGFADQNIEYHDGDISFKWVTEHQLGVMLQKQFYVVLEYRINELLPAEKTGFGYGLQYVVLY